MHCEMIIIIWHVYIHGCTLHLCMCWEHLSPIHLESTACVKGSKRWRGHEESLGDGSFVYDLGVRDVYLSPNSSSCRHESCAGFSKLKQELKHHSKYTQGWNLTATWMSYLNSPWTSPGVLVSNTKEQVRTSDFAFSHFSFFSKVSLG